jgi:hypothetical protein
MLRHRINLEDVHTLRAEGMVNSSSFPVIPGYSECGGHFQEKKLQKKNSTSDRTMKQSTDEQGAF